MSRKQSGCQGRGGRAGGGRTGLDRPAGRSYNGRMEFEISPELVDQVIFGMENQDSEYVLDAERRQVIRIRDIPEEEAEAEDRYVPLPEWQSVHGYNLMEQFVATIRNPIYRESLREVLAAGRGVFRQFKNTLKQRPDIEQLWFRFKEREMRRIVLDWYNQFRESWGLSKVQLDFEETDDLVASDFSFRFDPPEYRQRVTERDRQAFEEMFPDAAPAYVQELYRQRRVLEPESERTAIVAETPAGEFAGFLLAREVNLERKLLLARILQLYVEKEYRGLGIARAMVQKFCEQAYGRGIERINVELAGGALCMVDFFRMTGFTPFSQTLELDLNRWESD